MSDGLDALGDLIERERELAALREKLAPILDAWEIVGPLRADMVADPERALRIAERVINAQGIRRPGAYMNTLWRQSSGQLTQTAAPLAPEPEAGPPTLSAVEFAWSRDASPMLDALLDAMASAIAAAGGFASIRESFSYVESYDSDGNLLERKPA